ncbi:Crp/Fnr family transcriptional regulator [Tepidibacter hydrothermalis]|uniref:Crp/Fnr family transcriptional regulator n=1 Tax=Tepidibacter hydrothermalis TaxID=3036126 RepID=A0ABY8EJF8_9FIRM|nr:Crp/Fnr family transcriptional regulator [Tepidibacter hydrothermalis]WFD11175.1 Crp/Fnr family transcriptional regulator [Tepidibacter hydrothermalis]
MFENMDIFSNIDKEIIKDMKSRGLIKIYEKDEIIFSEAEEKSNVYLVCSGKIILYRSSEEGDEKIIYILGSGDFLNEVCIDDKNTSANAKVMEDSKIICFSKRDIISWMRRDFNFNMIIMNSLSNKLRRSFRQIKNLGLKKTNYRIAARLWKLARDYGCSSDENIHIDINMTHSQLASMVGTSRESVSRFLKNIERKNIIKQKNQKIIICSLSKLEDYTKSLS